MSAQAASEHAIAVCDMNHIAGASASCIDGARDKVGPIVQIVHRVTDDDRLARRATGRMQTHELVAGYGKEPEGIMLAKIRLGHEREVRQISEPFQIRWMNALFLAFDTVWLNIVVRVFDGPLQSLQLKRCNLVTACSLDRVQSALWVLALGHCCCLLNCFSFTETTMLRFRCRFLTAILSSHHRSNGGSCHGTTQAPCPTRL